MVQTRSTCPSERKRLMYTARLSNRSPPGASPVSWISETATVIGVDATAVLVKGATERRPELHEHERQVVLAAGAVPGSSARAIFPRDIPGEEVESGCVITLPDRIEYGLGTVELGMVAHLCLQCRECRLPGSARRDRV